MSEARQTQLAEYSNPKGGAFSVTYAVEKEFTKIHANATGTINVKMMDDSIATIKVIEGSDYLISGKQIDGNPDTPSITAWK